MIGAIAGDMIGASYERSHIKRKDFEIVVSGFTDDTVLTVAVADAVLNKGELRPGPETVCAEIPTTAATAAASGSGCGPGRTSPTAA